MSPFIVVEGPSGVGKSTAAKLLADRIGGTYMHGPPEEMDALRGLVDGRSDQLRPLFYAVGNALCSRKVETLLMEAPVVLDRYVHTTIAWHVALGFRPRIPWRQLDLLRPDAAFLLTTQTESARLIRLSSRANEISDRDRYSMHADEVTRRSYMDLLRSYGLVEIDTTMLQPDQVVDEMVRGLRRLGEKRPAIGAMVDRWQ